MRPASLTWLRRGCFAAILLGLAVAPGPASAARPCDTRLCQAAGQARWTEPAARLVGGRAGAGRHTPAQAGEAYAAIGRQLAVVGLGDVVQAYRASTGSPLWISSAGSGFGDGAQIVAVRSWPKVITAGVSVPGRSPGAASTRGEVVLSAASGLILVLPSGPVRRRGERGRGPHRDRRDYGGDLLQQPDRRGAVSRPIGAAAQAWKTDGNEVYLTGRPRLPERGAGARVAQGKPAHRGAAADPAAGPVVPGRADRAIGGVLVFTGPRGSIAYSGSTGAWLSRAPGRCGRRGPGERAALPVPGQRAVRRGPVDRPDRGARAQRVRARGVRVLRGARRYPAGPGPGRHRGISGL